MQTFHDLTETEDMNYRNPGIEELLIQQGYLERKNGKLISHLSSTKESPESYSTTITTYESDKTAFNEVVKMFCDEIEKQLGIRVVAKDFIWESALKDRPMSKFTLPVPKSSSDEQKLRYSVAKKNVQLQIKGVEKYKGVTLVGVKKLKIPSSEVKAIFEVIETDKQLHNHNGPIYLNVQLIFYTAVLDYDRFTDFARKIDNHLDLSKINYAEYPRR